MNWIWIGVAGAAGALSRHGVSQAAEYLAPGFPWGTIVVNVVGSVLLGVVAEAVLRGAVSPELKLLLGTGFLGAFTTYSTFSVETARLIQDERWMAVIGSVGGNLFLGLGGAFLGFALARQFIG